MSGEREIPSRLLYRDPLEILIAQEAKTCKGCRHEHMERLWGTKFMICMKRKTHGRRCKNYSTGETA